MASYFPKFSLLTENSDTYNTDWPVDEVQFEKRYAQRISLGYKVRKWNAHFRLKGDFDASLWQPDYTYVVGDFITVESTVGADLVYMCVVPGVSGAESEEPDWPDTQDETVVDNDVTWICYKENKLEALLQFIDDRRGRCESFNVWFPMYQEWVNCVFPTDGIEIVPVKPNSYEVVDVNIKFEEDYSDAG